MNLTTQSDIFFFISSLGFVLIATILAILIIYIIRAVNTWNRIIEKIEKDIEAVGDTTAEMLEDMRESAVFRFLFQKKKNKNRKSLKP